MARSFRMLELPTGRLLRVRLADGVRALRWPRLARLTPCGRGYSTAPLSSMGAHSSWLQIHARASSTLKNVSVGSFGPS